jgi:hypothetical protein
MNTFQVLNTLHNPIGHVVSTVTTATATPKDNLGTRAYNICGWAHLTTPELDQLHKCNDNGWNHFNNANSKRKRKAVVEAYFIQPLVKQQPQFR